MEAVLELNEDVGGTLTGPRGGRYEMEPVGGEYVAGVCRRWYEVRGKGWIIAIDKRGEEQDAYFARALSPFAPKWTIRLT